MEQEWTAPNKYVHPLYGKGLRGLYFGAQITEKLFSFFLFSPVLVFKMDTFMPYLVLFWPDAFTCTIILRYNKF